jgi:ABC-type Mn2+/Zn2+ transport system permease subunit
MADHGQELFILVKAYAQQETIDPLKTLGRYVAVGLAASIVMGIGVILLLLGVLRVLQTETDGHLTGSLTWVPYAVTLVFAIISIAIAAWLINRRNTKKGAR